MPALRTAEQLRIIREIDTPVNSSFMTLHRSAAYRADEVVFRTETHKTACYRKDERMVADRHRHRAAFSPGMVLFAMQPAVMAVIKRLGLAGD